MYSFGLLHIINQFYTSDGKLVAVKLSVKTAVKTNNYWKRIIVILI